MRSWVWKMFAHEVDYGQEGREIEFHHLGPKWWTEMHDLDEPIVEVEVTEDPDGTYYGWIEFDDKHVRVPCMIQPDELRFRMCFNCDPEDYVKAGSGEILKLSVRKIN